MVDDDYSTASAWGTKKKGDTKPLVDRVSEFLDDLPWDVDSVTVAIGKKSLTVSRK